MKSKIIQIQGISFKNEEISYTAPTWEEMGEYCFLLAQKVIESGDKYDRLVTMAKGGWTWAKTTADYLRFKNVASIHVELYSHFTQKTKQPVLLQALPVTVKGERILLFDDISDTGETLAFARKYLQMSGVKSIKIATLFYKPWSTIKPDFYVCQADSWLILPHEIRETVDHIAGPWLKKGISKKEVLDRLKKIGLPQDQVEYFLKFLK